MSHEDLPLMNGFPLNASESGKGLGYSLSIRSLIAIDGDQDYMSKV